MLPFAIGNFFGPLLLGPLFDPIARKPMIASTYAVSGVLLAIKSTGLFTPRIGRGLSRRRCGWMYRNSTSA